MNTLFEPPDADREFLSFCLPGRLTSSPVIKLPVKTANMITVTTPTSYYSTFGTASSFPGKLHSTTRVAGRLSLRYPISSLLEPGQFVSSSSSSCRSWIRLERPLDVSWVQPARNIEIFLEILLLLLSTILGDRICRNSMEKNIIEFLFVTNL